MSVNDKRVFAMALVLVALMSIFVPVASAGSQTWYLYTDRSLDKTAPGTVGTYDFEGWKRWTAGAAECDLTMGAGTWTAYIDYNAPCDGYINVEVQNVESNIFFASKYLVAISSGSGTVTVDMTNGISADFDTGQHLAFKFKWNPYSSPNNLTVYCGSGKSTLTSPTTDPGYPVPEMSTLALFSVGLLALAGYVVYRRRNI